MYSTPTMKEHDPNLATKLSEFAERIRARMADASDSDIVFLKMMGGLDEIEGLLATMEQVDSALIDANEKSAQAYQVVGSLGYEMLGDDWGDRDDVNDALDYFAATNVYDYEFLPWGRDHTPSLYKRMLRRITLERTAETPPLYKRIWSKLTRRP